MNVEINKQYELILAFYTVYLLKHPELRDKFEFIETPNNEYMKELIDLINPDKYPEIIKYITNFTDETVPINISIGIDDFYEIDNDKIRLSYIEKYLNYGSVDGFCQNLKKLAHDINWDMFFKNHKDMYEKFVLEVCNFPENLDLRDIEKYYSVNPSKYIFIPSMLMNGGFGPNDKLGNFYYVRGFYYNEDKNNFEYDGEYILECLFHEFSHPVVNPFVNKYITGDILEKFYNLGLENNLHPVYSSEKSIIACEYLVRANAYILASKYYKMPPIKEYKVIEYGFKFLPDLVQYTLENLPKYKNYEDFVKYGVIEFMNRCLDVGKENVI